MIERDISTPGNRLRWARARAGFKTAKAAAKSLRVGEVSYRAYENDQHGYLKHAMAFARKFGVSAEWLLEGVGKPYPDSIHPELPASAPAEVEFVRMVDINYAMGDGSIIEDYPDTELLPFNLSFLRQFTSGSTDDLFIAKGHGDSMEPTLRREDRLMIDTSQRIIRMQDHIWAISYAGVGMVKRVRRLANGMLSLLSDNPSVPAQDVSEEDVYVVGKVVWVARVM